MPHSRERGLRDKEIIDLMTHLPEDSEIEDFIPSDEDLGDEEFVVHDSEQESSSSTESEVDNTETPHLETSIRAQLRGQSRRGYGGRSRGRRIRRDVTQGLLQDINIPSTSGSTINWSVKPFAPKSFQLSEPSYLPIKSSEFNKIDYFQQYIDDNIVSLIVEKSNQTAVLKTGKSLDLTITECYIYIGITLVMASISYPNIRMYWEKKYRVALIADAMPRSRFLTLRNSLKIVFDPDITGDLRSKDKLWRVRPLLERVKSGCLAQRKELCLSIDEMIIPFTGNCGIRIYCPGKPNPVGIKAFVLANPNGMICDFNIYQGSTTYPEYEKSNFGLGDKAVLTLADSLVPGHVIYCDRYFTSEKLLDELSKRGIGCTGTLMKNRIPKEVRGLLMSDRDMKKKGRGNSTVVVRNDNKMAITKWFDNKPVILASTVEAKEEEDTCQRWCKQQKLYKTVNRPRCVRQYNKNMGGVDLADRLLAICPNRYRTRKWTQRFMAHMIDLSVSNSWVLFKEDQRKKGIKSKKNDQLRFFKLFLGETLIEKNQMTEGDCDELSEIIENPQKRSRGMPSVPIPPKIKRTIQAKHMPNFSTIQGRCRHCHENKTFFECSSCNVRLCLTKKRNCYTAFHNND